MPFNKIKESEPTQKIRKHQSNITADCPHTSRVHIQTAKEYDAKSKKSRCSTSICCDRRNGRKADDISPASRPTINLRERPRSERKRHDVQSSPSNTYTSRKQSLESVSTSSTSKSQASADSSLPSLSSKRPSKLSKDAQKHGSKLKSKSYQGSNESPLHNGSLSEGSLHEDQSKSASLADSDYVYVGPTVDDGASYSSIGITELNQIRNQLIHKITSIDPKPPGWSRFEYLRFGGGAHSSPSRKILGSVPIFVRTNSGALASIRHLVIEGSSLWLIGRNVTRRCDILHINANKIRLSRSPNEDYIDMKDHNQHSHIDFSRFTRASHPRAVMSSIISIPTFSKISSRIKNGCDFTEEYVRRVNDASDNSFMFDKRNVINAEKPDLDNIQNYLATVFARCSDSEVRGTNDSIRLCTCTELNLIKYQF